MEESLLRVLILAAGKGTRMHAQQAKVLHPLGGIPLVAHPIHTAQSLSPERIVLIVGHQAQAVESALSQRFGASSLHFALQAEQRGTAHAVMCAKEYLGEGATDILLLSGDVPLLSETTLRALLQKKAESKAALAMLTFRAEEPKGYGRIVRDATGRVLRIQEEKDCDDAERRIKECNAGIYCVQREFLAYALSLIDNKNAQGEYYLTDIVSLAVREGLGVEAMQVDDPTEVMGVNDRQQLCILEQLWLAQRQHQLMQQGVTLHLPQTIWLDYDVQLARDIEIHPHCALYGRSSVATGCLLAPGTLLYNAHLPEGTKTAPYQIYGSPAV
jgi:bifunctional UDP-N-acetylglucosamine pyrophosphorylase/glucosamine-1-phosphate N-acetyltransferase